MFEVKTDENLFIEIHTMISKIRQLFIYFQNPNTEMTFTELEKWHRDCTEYQEELSILIAKCDDRIVNK